MSEQGKVKLVLHFLTKEEEYRLFTHLARLRREGKCARGCGGDYDYDLMEHKGEEDE